jgi:hypothetical protein
MRETVSFLVCAVLILACANHKSTKPDLTPEQLNLADQALELATKSDAFLQKAPPDLEPKISEFNHQAQRFSNTSQRFGAGSLEARNVFDQLRYQAAQINQTITKESYPDLYPQWQELRDDIDKIATRLGYRIESR